MTGTELAHFRLPADAEFPYDRIGHFIVGQEPGGATRIGDEEAKQLNDEITARSPVRTRAAPEDVAPPVDPSPEIEDLKKQVAVLREAVAEYMEGVKAGKA